MRLLIADAIVVAVALIATTTNSNNSNNNANNSAGVQLMAGAMNAAEEGRCGCLAVEANEGADAACRKL